MSKNPLQTCLIQLEPHEVGVAKTLDLGVGGRSVIFGQAVRPRIEIQAGQLEHTLSMHIGDVRAALRLSDGTGEQTRFLTVGADRTICISNLHGKLEGRLSGHRRRILGVWELTNNRLVSWSEDKRLIVWDTRSFQRLARIRTRAPSVEHIAIASTGEPCITQRWWQTRIVSLQGKTIAVLKPQAEPLTKVRRLSSSAWLTVSKTSTKLWSAQGTLLSPLPQFSLDEGLFELPDTGPHKHCAFIVDDQHQIHLLAASGARLGTRAADEPMAKELRAYFKNQAQARKAIGGEPTHSQFGIRDNPFCDVAIPGVQAPKPAVRKDVPGPASCWHFFNRPRHAAIQSWLQAEVKVASDAATRVNAAIHAHQRAARLAGNLKLLAWISLAPSTLALIIGRSKPQLWAALIAALVSIGLALWQKREARMNVAAQRALSWIPAHIADFLLEVEAARSGMRAALPCIATPGVYDGSSVHEHIDKIIQGKLVDAAFAACELKPRDLITVELKPIILRDWSLLVVPDEPGQVTPNLRAFWWAPDGCFLVAVERVQIVLPTFDVMYVFSVDYDFAADRCYNAALHVFYYRDVANVIIRASLRALALPVGATTVAVKEMQVVLESGEPATLGALHETSAHALRQAALSAAGASNEDLRRNLETEMRAYQPAHRKYVQDELTVLQAESLVGTPSDDSRKGVSEALSYLKQLILERKDPPILPAPGVWGRSARKGGSGSRPNA